MELSRDQPALPDIELKRKSKQLPLEYSPKYLKMLSISEHLMVASWFISSSVGLYVLFAHKEIFIFCLVNMAYTTMNLLIVLSGYDLREKCVMRLLGRRVSWRSHKTLGYHD